MAKLHRDAHDLKGLQMAHVKSKVILDEGRDEEVAVVVTASQAKIERNTRPPASFLQQFRLELALQELIVRSLIDQNRGPGPAAVLDQRGRIVFPPAR